MIHPLIQPLNEETAAAERVRILDDVRFHRNAAKRRLRDLDRLEAECASHGIRLIRESVSPDRERHREPQRSDHR